MPIAHNSPSAYAESRQGAIEFSKADFEEFSPDYCRVYLLNDRQVALILSCLRYAEWDARWEDRDIDEYLVTETIGELLSNCDELKQIRLQLTRIANAFYQSPDANQVATTEEELILDNQETSVATTLFNAMAEQGEQDYTDELVEIAGDLVAISALL